FPAISLMPLIAFSLSYFDTLSLNLYTTTCSTVFGWPKRFCTAAPRACSVPAAIPATNITAPRTICNARFMTEVISSSARRTLPVYGRHARHSNSRHPAKCATSPKWFDGGAPRPLPSQGGFILRRINANCDTLDLVFLSDRNLRGPRPNPGSGSNEAIVARYFQAAH